MRCLWFLGASSAQAGTITPDIIFGSGNTNRGFDVTTVVNLELGLRAKLRYDATTPIGQPNDQLGVGIIQALDGTYVFNQDDGNPPTGLAMWSVDWSINTNVTGSPGGMNLSGMTFEIGVDFDPAPGTALMDADFGTAFGLGAYFGDNSTPNGGGLFVPVTDPTGLGTAIANNYVAQNSFNVGWLGQPSAIGPGEFTIGLRALDGTSEIARQEITVLVNPPSVIPVPAGLPLLLGGLGLLAFLRRRATA